MKDARDVEIELGDEVAYPSYVPYEGPSFTLSTVKSFECHGDAVLMANGDLKTQYEIYVLQRRDDGTKM